MPCPLALVVVASVSGVLFGYNRWHREWELPGGIRQGGETHREAAVRELAEETGIEGVALQWVGLATFELTNPGRHEQAAVYRAEVVPAVELAANDEMSAFRWLPPGRTETEVNPLDMAIAVWVSRDPY